MSAVDSSLAALGKELRRRREALGRSVDDVAKSAGLSATTLASIERGERDPSAMVLVALAKTLGVSPGKLLGEAAPSNEDAETPSRRAPPSEPLSIEALSVEIIESDDDPDLEETTIFADSLQPGMFIGRNRYAILERIGTGGQAIVYKAEDTLLRRLVAVKLLLDEYAPLPETRDRFLREAQALASIDHPNIVQLLDIDQQPDGSYFVVQQLLEGETLRERMDAGPAIPRREAINSIVIPLVGALVSAHGKGIIHRDVKPENIILARTPSNDRIPKLIDFGIAKLMDSNRERLTQYGIAMGTPGYMSPEQIRDASTAGAPADVWGIGMLLFELVAGRLPFEGSAGTLLDSTATQLVPRIEKVAADVHAELAKIINEALDYDPEKRPTMRALRSRLLALRAISDDPATGVTLLAELAPAAGSSSDEGAAAARAKGLNERARKMRATIQTIDVIEDETSAPEEDPTRPFSFKDRKPSGAPTITAMTGTYVDTSADVDGLGEAARSKDPRMNRLLGEAVRALGMNALTNALVYVDRALLIGSPKDACMGSVELIAAIAHHWLGNYAEAERFAKDAVRDLPRGSDGWCTAAGYLATAYGDRGNPKELHAIMRELKAQSGSGASTAWVVAACRLSQALVRTGFPGPAQQVLHSARKRASERGGGGAALSRAWLAVAQSALDIQRGDVMRHLGSVASAIDAFGEARDVRCACVQRVNAGNAYMQLGGHKEAEAELRAVLRVAEPMHLRFVPALKVNLGLALARQNRLDEALAMETEAIELCKKQGDRRFECVGQLYLANILLRRDDARAAVKAAEEAIQCAADFPGLDAYARATLGSIYLRQSKAPRALLAAKAAMDLLTKLNTVEEGEALIRVVEAEALYANDQKADALAKIKAARDRLAKIADEIDDPHWRRSFLENVPENARTIRFAAKWAMDEAEDDTAIR